MLRPSDLLSLAARGMAQHVAGEARVGRFPSLAEVVAEGAKLAAGSVCEAVSASNEAPEEPRAPECIVTEGQEV